jgi:hypothetical protein
MLTRVLPLLCALLFTASSALAAEMVAVLEPTGPMEPGVLMKLSDEARTAAIEVLPASHFKVMTRENMQAFAEAMDIDLSQCDAECEVDTGRNIGANYIVSGNVIKVSGTWILTLKAFETKEGTFIGSSEARGADELALVDQVRGAASKLFSDSVATRIRGVGAGAVGAGGAVKLADLDMGDTIVNAAASESAFLMVNSEPQGATLYINGQEKGATPYQEELPWGRYKLTLDLGLYHPAQKEIEIDSTQTREVPFVLKPAFGSLKVTSVPSQASVYLDGELVGKTPLNLQRKPSRVYGIRIEARDFNTFETQVTIEDEKQAEVSATLDSSVGGISIDSQPQGAQVRLNGEMVGTTPYQVSRKPPGEYTVKLSMPKYLSQEVRFQLDEGAQVRKKIVMPANFGTLAVRSDPAGAQIEMGGKNTGKRTPYRFEGVQAGTVLLALSKPGHGTWRGKTQIEVGREVVVEQTLDAMLGSLVIKTTLPDGSPCRGEVTVDGKSIGQAPMVHQVVATVPHKVRAECKGMAAAQTATVAHDGRTPVNLKVANFSMADLRTTQGRLKSSKQLDMAGMAGSAGLFIVSGVSFGTSSKAYAAAAQITGAGQNADYDTLRAQGASARMTGIGLAVVGTGLLSATIWHKLKKTKKKAAEVEYVSGQLGR